MKCAPAPVRRSLLRCCGLLLIAAWLNAHAEPVDFTLPDVDGNPVHLSDYRDRWVVVNFWATWCGPCVREIPELVAFQRDNPQAQVLGINFEQISAAEAKRFAARFEVNYPILKAGEEPLVPFEPLNGLPTTAIVTPDGLLVANHTGAVTQKMLEDFIRRETGQVEN